MNYKNNSLVNLFEEQVAISNDRIAICFDGKQLTYKELNEKSNQVAHYLVEQGTKPGDIVGLLFDRSADFIIAMWGVLKAGAAYLPLAPELPQKRISFMLDKSNTSCIIAQNKHAELYNVDCDIHTMESESISNQSKQNLEVIATSGDIAYCIFTSGSTGYPKGVLMKQSSVINLVEGLKGIVYDTYEDRKINVALLASFAFDASVQQMFPALLLGHTLHVSDDHSRKDGESLRHFFNDNKIDISDGTPMHLGLLVKACSLDSKLETLSNWLLAGEVLNKKSVRTFYEKLGNTTQLYNLYGPTETCVDSTSFKIDPSALEDYESIPIGKPLPNERIYIIDNQGDIVSEGEVGELCIAGEGLAKGYVNNDELTDEKFNSDWIENESRVYRTGDMTKLLPDGNLLYQGRIDNQIKLRGLRIELSEIEFQTCTYELVNHAVVVTKEIFQEEQLVLYYEAATTIEESVLRNYLLERLPNYMVPSHFVHMEELPLTISGKVDRYALPDVEVLAEKNDESLNDIEKKLVEIWEEVLEVPPNWVGGQANFFQFGGNSLKSILIANRIKQEFNVEISIAQFFEFQTISNFSDFISNAKGATREQTRVLPATDVNINPLTLAQKCFYFIDSLKNKTSLTYHIPQIFELRGEISEKRLSGACRKLIQRYEILRTSFYENETGIQCEVANEFDFEVTPLTFNGDVESAILNFMQPFSLDQGPLLRVGLLKVEEGECVLILDVHHIVSDEASNRILIQELLSLYDGNDLPEPELQYRDYAVWQQEEFYQNLVANHKEYWLNKYIGEIPVLDLPTDHTRPLVLTDKAHACTIKLEKSLCDDIRQSMAKENTTIFNFLFAAYYVFLNKISNEEEIVVGTPVSGRQHVDLEKIVGLFVNTLPIRNSIKGEMSVKDFLSDLQKNTLQSLDHQYYPYKELVDELKIPRDVNRNPLFDVCFNYNHEIEERLLRSKDFSMEAYDMLLHIAKFDLTLDIIDSPEGIALSLIGRKDLFELATIERFANYLKRIIEQISSDSSQRIEDIDILPETEKEQLLAYNLSNGMPDMSILEVISNQVESTPDKEAIVFNDQTLTYRELEEQSNQLANYLISKGVDKEELVGIMLDRSLEMIVSLLAVLKMGSAYVPLDAEFPDSRIVFQLEDAGINCVLTSSKYEAGLQEKGCTTLALDTCWNEVIASSNEPTGKVIQPDDLMYIIYTSGSTGRPKGVLVEHKGLVNMAFALNRRFNMTEEDRILQFARITFDASISEILMAFFSGATLVLVEKETIIDGESIIDYMKEQQVSFAFFTPAYLKVLDKKKLKFLRCIISGGESARVEDLQYLSKHMECHNVYGPTECSAIVSGYKVDPDKDYTNQIPIGTPFINLKAYILDKNNKVCPTGILGELCIGGVGVTRGYLNREELTAEKFVINPFDPAEKMYRTGDYARWNAEGQIEFIGRKDNQVKIRGFRIELGEIEAVLDESSFVKQASVQLIEDERGNKQIVAYVVPDGDFDNQVIQNYLGNKLPNYMTPSYLVTLDNIPLTSHGKIDREKLVRKQKSKTNVTRPTNEVESILLDIWSKELGLQSDLIGTDDNFFELGGNSLNAMQIVIKINAALNTETSISELFRFQTITQLAKQIEIDQWLDNSMPVDQTEKRTEALL